VQVASSDSLVYAESVDGNSLGSHRTPLEHLRAAAKVADERGHPAESFIRSAAGRIFTPERFSDNAFDAAVDARRWVAARSLEASQWGLSRGADYVSRHWAIAASVDPSHFARLEPAWGLPYASAPGDSFAVTGVPFGAYGDTADLRVAPDGTTAITLQYCQDPDYHLLIQSECCLFEHDLGTGQARLITRLREASHGHGELSLSPDGRYLIAGYPTPQLVDVRTGHCAEIGPGYRAATWYPRGGASTVLAVTGEHDAPPWKLVLIDLSTFAVQDFADLPRRVDGVQVARDGTIAARMRPQEERGWFDELVVSTDNGRSFEPVAPLRGAGGWRRRGRHPRWIERRPAADGPVMLTAEFEESLRAVPPDNRIGTGEIGWVMDTVASLIRHRVDRLRAKPPATDVILAQLAALTALPAQLDPRIAGEVTRQVVPVARAAATTREGTRLAQSIADVAAGRQPPPCTIRFGG
jgi:hypothetical protein